MSFSDKNSELITLIKTKFHRPQITDDLVTRPHLLNRLNRGVGRKLTLICAPAGFGKTTLAATWLQDSPRAVAWLSLDENDNDLYIFLNYFVAAIQSVFPNACPQTQELWQSAQLPPLDFIVATLINEVADLPKEFLLVMDDYHVVQDHAVNQLLSKLLDHLPSRMHLVLICRTDPLIPVSRLRARQEMTEIRGPDLSFDLEEAQIYLEKALETELSPEIIVLLEERTEGWITGLRLAVLSLRGTDDPSAFARSFKGMHANVMDYLVDEVLSLQPQLVQDFMLQTSLLNRFCASLCAEVTGRSEDECQQAIDWLERSNLFVVSLDYERNWYRFHHLFQELLFDRLYAHTSDDEIAAMRNRASVWLGNNGSIGEAVQHALAAANVIGASHFVEQHRHDLLNNEDWRTLERWLNLLPDEVMNERPELLMAQAWVLRFQARHKEMHLMLQEAEKRLDDGNSETDNLSLRGEIDAIRSNWLVLENNPEKSLECAERALKHVPYSSAFPHGLALDSKCLAYQTIGRKDEAIRMLQDAINDPRYYTVSKIQMYVALCFIYQASGDLPQLLQTADEYLEMATDRKKTFGIAWANYFVGLVRYEWNELDAAIRHFSKVVELRYGVSFFVVKLSLLALAVAYQARGESDKAQETIEILHSNYRGMGNIGSLPEIRSTQARLSLDQGDLTAANQWAQTINPADLNEPIIIFEVQCLTWSAVHITQGATAGLQEATGHLQKWLAEAEDRHNTRRAIRILTLLAVAYDKQRQKAEAIEALERAITLAQPGGFIRVFVDSGSAMANLLHILAEQDVSSEYINRILATFPKIEIDENAQTELDEPLTPRELEVLRLLSQHLTYSDIAETLVISPRTAKKHVMNIYQKLDVNKRKHALEKAAAFGLFPSD